MRLTEAQMVFTQVKDPDDLKRIEQMLRSTFFPLSEFYMTTCQAEEDAFDGPYKATIKLVRRSRP